MADWGRRRTSLSRSLLDFARIMEIFEQRQISFVSVLTNRSHMLILLSRNPSMVLREVAGACGDH